MPKRKKSKKPKKRSNPGVRITNNIKINSDGPKPRTTVSPYIPLQPMINPLQPATQYYNYNFQDEVKKSVFELLKNDQNIPHQESTKIEFLPSPEVPRRLPEMPFKNIEDPSSTGKTLNFKPKNPSESDFINHIKKKEDEKAFETDSDIDVLSDNNLEFTKATVKNYKNNPEKSKYGIFTNKKIQLPMKDNKISMSSNSWRFLTQGEKSFIQNNYSEFFK